jgi:very-short-patch-repair endonuclease
MTEVFNRSKEGDNRRQLRNEMPETEVILWSRLKGRQLAGCKFRRQYSVGPFVIDFYSPEIKFGIELDGDSHFQEGARAYDEKRTEFISSFGIRIVRFLNADVDENLDGVLEAIGAAVLELRAMNATSQPPWQTPPGPPFLRGGRENNAGSTRASGRRPRRRGDEHASEAAPHVPLVQPTGERFRQSLSPPLEGGARGGGGERCLAPEPSPARSAPNEGRAQTLSPPLEGGARGGEPQRKPSPFSVHNATEEVPAPSRSETNRRRCSL